MLSKNKVVHAENTLCQNYKMYVIDLILPSVLKTAKHIRLYPATHYCTRLKGVKERIIQRSLGMFYFLIVMLRHFTLLYYLNPLMPGGNKSMC